MTVGITIAVLLNNTPETSEWEWKCSRSRDSYNSTIQNDEKSHNEGSSGPEDQNTKIKLEDTEPVFKLEDSKTWFAPAGVPSLKLLWRSPLDSPRQRTIKAESQSPELLDRDDRPCSLDSSAQTPEVSAERWIKSDPDLEVDSPIISDRQEIKEDIEEGSQNRLAIPEPSSSRSSSRYISTSGSPTPPAPKAPGRRPHHRRKSWPCQVYQCKGIFTNKRLYERHLSRDHRYKSTECAICGKTLGRKDYMTDHIRSKRHKKALDEQKKLRKEA
ncbi:hypothetical protein AOL_s00173g303 [Orbilia oligospora ATCC 24927]|uniref:C2H2-type domain-containing protein n=1 Tax=Arthrobotrys oligospora (strain ATCC 24927 / CBS 115.81 / DSM 1491) TaxID=756982 RepID=G1XPD5_ARTOA|nr:hypothetical protein AOL_s00173g303 [Orbilia oligospora ATCC 24927]EGX45202.1 hypothetical protein AOL_s00173g303 [Orbilia oligospora ATCC 24927]